jgi:uncharacterized protein (TIGR03435 family)
MRVDFEPILPGGRYIDDFARVRPLIQDAFRIPASYLLEGLPNWASDRYFAINAKADDGYVAASRLENIDHVRAMIRSMLVDRFHLAIHVEERPKHAFALRIDKAGFKLSARPTDESAAFGGVFSSAAQADGGGWIRGKSATMAGLAQVLTDLLEEPVQDDTGISGCFDFTIKWSGEGSGTPAIFGNPDFNSGLISTIRRELGLRFVAKTALVRYWVVTRIEEPSEN